MAIRKLKGIFYTTFFLMLTGCLEPYNPPEISEMVDILVVDGFLNASDQTVSVDLSKTSPISYSGETLAEENASVTLEEENGAVFTLEESERGHYQLSDIDIVTGKRYRLSIMTSNNMAYTSDFIDIKPTPVIDSLSWGRHHSDNGINVYVNTHDQQNSTFYYQWTFEETWEYSSTHNSLVRLENGNIVSQELNLSSCWISKPSTEIHIGSTEKLSEDVIQNFPLIFIPVGSQKLNRKYSILVRQRSLTKDAYDFWLQLKKTTESLGSLFDPLPYQVTGNLHSADAAPVIGYFSGGFTNEKRIFIRIDELPTDLRSIKARFCPVDTILLNELSSYPNMNLIGPYGMPFVEGYTYSSYGGCMDCRDEGGDIFRPEFWD